MFDEQLLDNQPVKRDSTINEGDVDMEN